MSALVAEVAVVNLDQLLWQAWKSMDVPEGFRAEIIEGTITLSPTGGTRHFTVNRRLGRALCDYLRDSGFGPAQDGNVIAVHDLRAMAHNVCWQLELDEAGEARVHEAFEGWWEQLRAATDANGDGKVSREEFLHGFTEFFTARADSTSGTQLLGRA